MMEQFKERLCTLRYTNRSCILRKLNQESEEEVKEVFLFVTDLGRRGLNLGVDEFSDFEFLKFAISFGDVWTLRNIPTPDGFNASPANDRQLEALILTQPARFSRSNSPTLAQLFVMTSYAARQQIRDVIHLGLTFVRENVQFSACVMEVFVTCTEYLLAARDEGFMITSYIPSAGVLNSRKNAEILESVAKSDTMANIRKKLEYTASYLLCTEWGEPAPIPIAMSPPDPDSVEPRMKPVPSYLPINHTLKNGMEITIRAMLPGDIPKYYEALKRESEGGRGGYGFDELPNIEYFKQWYIDEYYNYTIEEAKTGKIIGFQNYGSSIYSRSHDYNILSDGNNFLFPEYRGKGIATELLNIQASLFVDEPGYQTSFGETMALNIASLKAMCRAGFQCTGSVPRAVYILNRGWMDLVTLYQPVDHVKPLRELKSSAKL